MKQEEIDMKLHRPFILKYMEEIVSLCERIRKEIPKNIHLPNPLKEIVNGLFKSESCLLFYADRLERESRKKIKIPSKGLGIGMCSTCLTDKTEVVLFRGYMSCDKCKKYWNPLRGTFDPVCSCGHWASDVIVDNGVPMEVCCGCGVAIVEK